MVSAVSDHDQTSDTDGKRFSFDNRTVSSVFENTDCWQCHVILCKTFE